MPANDDIVDIGDSQAFQQDKSAYAKNTETRPKTKPNIGADTNNGFFSEFINAAEANKLDAESLNSFTSISQSRDQVYALLDIMCEDPTVYAVLETYVEDTTERSQSGEVVWCESDNEEVFKYVSYLLDQWRVDKNIGKWVACLCKYGDVYIRLYRESEYKQDDLFKDKNDRKTLTEDVKLKAFDKNDHYINYIEMVPNPAEMYELTKFGKTYAYIEAPVHTPTNYTSNYDISGVQSTNMNTYSPYRYKYKRDDIIIYNGTDFVHACLDDNSSRTPEEVNIYIDDADYDADAETNMHYTVRRGQSIFYSAYKIWREMQLLEASMLLNRVTKSSIVRILQVETGDMSKDQVASYLGRLKEKIEQKSAIAAATSMSEYTNPGPVVNTIYVPTHDGVGAITSSSIGGEGEGSGDLDDVEYFQNLFYGAMRVPKQYFSQTGDSTGFNGGTSLTLISSRYAKAIKRIQNVMSQMLTDAVNLVLVDRGLDSYINKFTIHMQEPTTQEEVDRRSAMQQELQVVGDIMNQLSDIQDPAVKLSILKSLLSRAINNPSVIQAIQSEIDKLEAEQENGEAPETGATDDFGGENDYSASGGGGFDDMSLGLDLNGPDEGMSDLETSAGEAVSTDSSLPSPSELGGDMDFTDNTQF